MKVCVVGKGGRENVLVKRLHDSPSKPEVFAFPGSDGISQIAAIAPVKDIDSLIAWMKAEGIDLCVGGEEAWLAKGLSDKCREAGIRAWGPVKESAQLESSKRFAKEFMVRHGVPTAAYEMVRTADELRAAARELPCVLKYDGLAAGKGVSVCFEESQVEEFVQRVFVDSAFGEGEVVVEECMQGKEVSVIVAVADGEYTLFTPARDYKRQLDNDEGPNTGGMGAVASRALVSPELLKTIEATIVQPTVEGLVKDGLDYRGFLYFGIMLTEAGPKILEFNVRFGDPEAQAILPLVDGDFAEFLYEAADGRLMPEKLQFDESWCVCLVLASRDYPVRSGSGDVIRGLDDLEEAQVFHAGTRKNENGEFETNGGRVLSIVSRGDTREEAVAKVYREVEKVTFDGAQHRTDIGRLHF